MALLQDWRDAAYNQNIEPKKLEAFWQKYFLLEKGIYEQLLNDPDTEVKGTVKELAEKFEIDIMPMTCAHRVTLSAKAKSAGLDEKTVIDEIVKSVPMPRQK